MARPPFSFQTLQPQQGDDTQTTIQKICASLADTIPASNAANGSDVNNDTVDLTNPTRAIFISADGDLKVNMVGSGTAITFTGLKAGQTMPIQASRIYATGTTATIIALW